MCLCVYVCVCMCVCVCVCVYGVCVCVFVSACVYKYKSACASVSYASLLNHAKNVSDKFIIFSPSYRSQTSIQRRIGRRCSLWPSPTSWRSKTRIKTVYVRLRQFMWIRLFSRSVSSASEWFDTCLTNSVPEQFRTATIRPNRTGTERLKTRATAQRVMFEVWKICLEIWPRCVTGSTNASNEGFAIWQ